MTLARKLPIYFLLAMSPGFAFAQNNEREAKCLRSVEKFDLKLVEVVPITDPNYPNYKDGIFELTNRSGKAITLFGTMTTLDGSKEKILTIDEPYVHLVVGIQNNGWPPVEISGLIEYQRRPVRLAPGKTRRFIVSITPDPAWLRDYEQYIVDPMRFRIFVAANRPAICIASQPFAPP